MFEHVEGIRKKDRRGALPAAAAAALVHLALIALLAWGVRNRVLLAVDPAGTGPLVGFPDGGGGGGGGSGGEEVVSYVDVAAPAPQPEEAVVEPVPEEDVLIPPEPTPVPEPPKAQTPTETPQTRPAAVTPGPASPGAEAGTGGGQGTGTGPGEGSGVGPGSGSGTGGGDGSGTGSGRGPGEGGGGGRIRPPATDVLLIPPDRPSGVASQEITIRLTVDVRGRVRDARLTSSTGNRGFDERVRRWALSLVFRPAVDTATNRPVEATTEVKVFV